MRVLLLLKQNNETLNRILTNLLRDINVEIEITYSCVEAWEILLNSFFDYIFVDYQTVNICLCTFKQFNVKIVLIENDNLLSTLNYTKVDNILIKPFFSDDLKLILNIS